MRRGRISDIEGSESAVPKSSATTERHTITAVTVRIHPGADKKICKDSKL